jgi:hypothetical protein
MVCFIVGRFFQFLKNHESQEIIQSPQRIKVSLSGSLAFNYFLRLTTWASCCYGLPGIMK